MRIELNHMRAIRKSTLFERGPWSCLMLVRRQLAVILADKMGLFLMFVQPLLISALLALVVTQQTSAPKKLFLGMIAVMWLACSNGAQVVVRERAIVSRERLAGLRLGSYVMSKYFSMGLLASIQAMLLYLGLKVFGNGVSGNVLWQIGSLVSAAWVMTAIGVWISAACSNPTQAALVVPLVIIPQILLAGYVFPLEEWKTRPVAAVLGFLSPSRTTQYMLDVSLFYGRRLDLEEMERLGLDAAYKEPPHWRNLRLSVIPIEKWIGLGPDEFEIPVSRLQTFYAIEEGGKPFKPVMVKWPSTPNLPVRRIYYDQFAWYFPVVSLSAWMITSFFGALWVLSKNLGNLK